MSIQNQRKLSIMQINQEIYETFVQNIKNKSYSNKTRFLGKGASSRIFDFDENLVVVRVYNRFLFSKLICFLVNNQYVDSQNDISSYVKAFYYTYSHTYFLVKRLNIYKCDMKKANEYCSNHSHKYLADIKGYVGDLGLQKRSINVWDRKEYFFDGDYRVDCHNKNLAEIRINGTMADIFCYDCYHASNKAFEPISRINVLNNFLFYSAFPILNNLNLG